MIEILFLMNLVIILILLFMVNFYLGLVWCISGIICGLYWPIKYRHNMTKEGWLQWSASAWLLPLEGPFAFIFGMPLE